MHAARLEQKRQNRELAGSMANVGTSEVLETFLRGTEMHAARLEQKRQNGELAGSMANAGKFPKPSSPLTAWLAISLCFP